MYVLLNLKDGSRLSEVVQLLFTHGHTAVSVAESVEDLCPRCERANKQIVTKAENPPVESRAPTKCIQQNPTVPTSSFTAQITSQPLPLPLPNVAVASDNRILNEGLSSEEVQEDSSLREESEGQPLPLHSEEALLSEAPHAVEVKDEAVEECKNRRNDQEANENEAEQHNISSAIELLCQAGTSNTRHSSNDLELDVGVDRNTAKSLKRKARLEQMGLDTYQCQLCKKAITRQGQYANLVNHLSRHARLHASRKQYCCPVCRASFSRRYLAYSHVREAHPKHGFVEPTDHGRELREEYRALLEVCFPGARNRYKTASHAQPPAPKKAATPTTKSEQSEELSRLLQL